MSLQSEVCAAFRKNVFEPLFRPGTWKVLIMDERATRLLSSVFRMQDITEFGITLVESLYLARKSFNMEAIYLMYPHRREVDILLRDYSSGSPKYPAAHVFFLLPCPRDILNAVAASNCIRFIKTMAQLDLDFIPVESCLYTFECSDTAQIFPLPSYIVQNKQTHVEQLAEQLATVCVTLQEYPRVCYRKTDNNLELARLTQMKLDACRESNPSMGQGSHKDRSILLIVDRGFDPVTPLLHELTLQAMCYDLLPVADNTYTYGEDRKINVLDQDPVWKDLRHTHIADVTRILPKLIREFAESHKNILAFEKSAASDETKSGDGGLVNEGAKQYDVRDLANLIKRMPQYQSETASYSGVYSVAQECMRVFREGVDKLCELEQDLVMGQTANGETLRDPMRTLAESFRIESISAADRLRLLMVFILIKEGVAESHLDRLLDTARVPRGNKALFASLSMLIGAQLIQPDPVGFRVEPTSDEIAAPQCHFAKLECFQRLPPVSKVSDKVQRYLPVKNKRKDRVEATSYALSRWTPYLLDIMEAAIEGKLDKSDFEFLVGKGTSDLHGLGSPTEQPSPNFKGPSARFHTGKGGSGLGLPPTSASARTPSPGFGSFADRSGALRANSEHCGPRLIVCVVGGVAWSEVRSAYELTQKCMDTRLAESDRHAGPVHSAESGPALLSGGGGVGWNWEVMIGGTHILTPSVFLGDLESTSKQFATQLAAASQDKPSSRKSSQATTIGGLRRL
ncbi:unnamed protein product [Calicophoron daubneyi]|uniref:Syntaxin binding protein 1 n=1 Tax=Calicophoron daubneyi TaxID=300641 RepID=A0AAV2T509_CALDB